jgi:hypothetical protein
MFIYSYPAYLIFTLALPEKTSLGIEMEPSSALVLEQNLLFNARFGSML